MTLEDFTIYDKVDEDGDLTVEENTITALTMKADANAHVTDDKNIDHFGDFEHLVQFKTIEAETNTLVLVWGVSNGNFTWRNMLDNTDGLSVFLFRTGTFEYRLYLSDYESGYLTDIYVYDVNTDYWLTIKRNGTNLTCKIYLDEARTILDDTLLLSSTIVEYQYIIACGNKNDDAAPSDHRISCNIYDLDLQEDEIPLNFPLQETKGKGYKYKSKKENDKYNSTKGDNYKYKAKRQR